MSTPSATRSPPESFFPLTLRFLSTCCAFTLSGTLGDSSDNLEPAAEALTTSADALAASARLLAGSAETFELEVDWLEEGVLVGETGGVVTNLAKAADAWKTALPEEDEGVASADELLG